MNELSAEIHRVLEGHPQNLQRRKEVCAHVCVERMEILRTCWQSPPLVHRLPLAGLPTLCPQILHEQPHTPL